MKNHSKLQLGIDIGGTGIKGALVDIEKGELASDRKKWKTPQGAEPDDVLKVVKELLETFEWEGPVGCGFPAIIKDGVAHSAANVSKQWYKSNVAKFLTEGTGQIFHVLNDADAAGVAELSFGKAKDVKGTVIILTVGTGIGSGMFVDGKLVPNMEFGHLKFKGGIAEHFISNKIRKQNKMDWNEFGSRLNEYLNHIDFIFSPNKILLSGGVSVRFDEYKHKITLDYVDSAALYNNAGIIGCAINARNKSSLS